MPNPLSGVRAKIDRSEYHLDQFKVALHAGISTTRVELRSKERNAEGHHVVTGDIFPGEPPPEIGVPIGDAIHNLRCALDQLVCQLAVIAGNPQACGRTQFPVFVDDTPDNRKMIKRRINGLAPTAQAAIEALQPYQRRPSDPHSDPLWLLSELDNIDKHRLLLVVNPKLAELDLDVTIDGQTKSYAVSQRPEWRPLKLDAVPFRLTIPNDPSKPQTNVQVKAHPLIGVVFAQTGLKCDGAEAIPTVRTLIAEVKFIVDDFEKQFF